MKRIAIEKMDGTKFNAIATTEFDYAKDSKWLYAHGFRYTNAVYNEKAGREPKAMFHVNEAKFAEKFPKEYAVICKRDGIKPLGKKAQPKAEEPQTVDLDAIMAEIKALKKENATLKGQLTKMRKAASK